ncbi:alpha-galactosidase [Thermoactinospora rubra]|uniref:alpha-galactosidase n=1 Tax=Thermoactinospora rubra TaxID=1088767 RepID=UPI00197FD71A|nr:alpha-galactosidase [Thermoactinospora rubra]
MTSVSFDSHSGVWLLRTRTTAYAMRLDGDGLLRHLHWGGPLSLEDARRLPPPAPPASSFDGVTGEEYPCEGGARFGVPSLQVRFPDRSRDVEWDYAGHDIDGGELTIRLRDRHHPLEADLCYRVRHDCDVIERWTVLRNTAAGGPAFELLRADSACWTLPALPSCRLSHTTGGWTAEGRLHRVPLPHAETTLTSRRGVSSHHVNPWLMIDAGDADERRGEVWSGVLAWSGSWRITVQRTAGSVPSFTGGAGHEGPAVLLGPGESWQTPVFAGLYSAEGFGGASRAWHRYIAAHVLPHPDELRPVVYNSWEATGFDVDEEGQRRLARLAAAVGAELFVVDDGWYGERRSDEAGLGDWTPNRERFPRGLAPLAAEVRRLGMKFGLWVEPEMVNPDSDLYRRHPDWVLHLPHRARTTLRNQLVLNFARPDVAEWAYSWLDDLVTAHGIDYLKWDMNRALAQAGWPGHADPDRVWSEHVRNVYRVMDRLRAQHPALRIEACAGGGGRLDLGILAHADLVWPSDNTDAVDRIAIQHGFSQIHPARTMSAWVTDSPNPLTGRSLPLDFRFHVAMTGVLGIGGNLPAWDDTELKQAATLVAAYKRVRPVIQLGEQYRLPDAVQYVHQDRVVVIAWRLPSGRGLPVPPLRLAGLDPEAAYRDEETGEVHLGAALMNHGLTLALAGDHASTLVRLVRE